MIKSHFVKTKVSKTIFRKYNNNFFKVNLILVKLIVLLLFYFVFESSGLSVFAIFETLKNI